MLNLICFSESPDKEKFLRQIRDVFSTVFAAHYSAIIASACRDPDPRRLEGFSDLIAKHFSGDVSQYTREDIRKKLKALYAGPGIDDEIAFLLGLPTDIQQVKGSPDLSEDQQKDITEYLEELKKTQRILKDVDALAIVDIHGKIHGFCIYHLFYQDGKTILHVRQAAMLEKNKGFAGIVARYLAERYPHAIYEANQRWGNTVKMKEMLLHENLLKLTPPVLGYSEKYQGIRSSGPLFKMLLKHYVSGAAAERKNKLEMSPTSLRGSWEAESLRPVYSAVSFFKASVQDDMYLEKVQFYLKRNPLDPRM